MRRSALAFPLVGLLAIPLAADVVHLKGGAKMEGRVVERTPDRIILETPTGRVPIPTSRIERIEAGRTVWDEYAERRAALKEGEAAGLWELHLWCSEQKLKTEAARLLQEVLALDPQHPEANREAGHILYKGNWYSEEKARALGLKPHEGRWLSDDEIMEARGYVRYKGQWVLKSEVERLEEIEELRELLGHDLLLKNSRHFGVRTMFEEGIADGFLARAEKAYEVFQRLLPFPEEELFEWAAPEEAGPREERRRRIRRIYLYLFRSEEEKADFYDKANAKYGFPNVEEEREYWRTNTHFNTYFPRAAAVIRPSKTWPKVGDLETLIVHSVAHILVNRYTSTFVRRPYDPPDWLEEALAHVVEEEVFRHARAMCLTLDGLTHAEMMVPQWRHSKDWRTNMARLLDDAGVCSFDLLMKKPLGALTSKDRAKGYGVLRMLLEKHPGKLAELLKCITEKTQGLCFAEALGWGSEDVDREWRAWIKERF